MRQVADSNVHRNSLRHPRQSENHWCDREAAQETLVSSLTPAAGLLTSGTAARLHSSFSKLRAGHRLYRDMQKEPTSADNQNVPISAPRGLLSSVGWALRRCVFSFRKDRGPGYLYPASLAVSRASELLRACSFGILCVREKCHQHVTFFRARIYLSNFVFIFFFPLILSFFFDFFLLVGSDPIA